MSKISFTAARCQNCTPFLAKLSLTPMTRLENCLSSNPFEMIIEDPYDFTFIVKQACQYMYNKAR